MRFVLSGLTGKNTDLFRHHQNQHRASLTLRNHEGQSRPEAGQKGMRPNVTGHPGPACWNSRPAAPERTAPAFPPTGNRTKKVRTVAAAQHADFFLQSAV